MRQLPAPGPAPAARPLRLPVLVVFVVVITVMVWLIMRGYTLDAAFEICSAVSVLAAAITARMTGPQSADG